MTAIPLADTDGNPDTAADPDWLPLVNTPSHPEYPAGHPSQNGAAATVLLSHFDDAQTFTLTTAGQPSRTYTSIAQARSDGNNARVWGGMHYPSTVAISDAVGEAIANYVNRNAMQFVKDNDDRRRDERGSLRFRRARGNSPHNYRCLPVVFPSSTQAVSRAARYGKNGLDDTRISVSNGTVSTARSPLGLRVPSRTTSSDDGRGFRPYTSSSRVNGRAMCASENISGGQASPSGRVAISVRSGRIERSTTSSES